MPNAIEFVAFKLKKEVSAQDFLPVSDRFNSDFLAKQKGYISRRLLTKGEMWADLVVWETEDDFQNAMKASKDDAVAIEYLSQLNLSAKGGFFHLFSVERSY
ncbi:MAG: cell wall metabolism sensor histidine kinase WalK [Oscillospiraceae bacterium]|jgi:phospholipid N-methyltransferase|nr:cell wall metabolism sensor histidine kinase WalK [Oscillospiraceae bacterium]